MAKYNDPDDFMDSSQVPWGVDEGKESIRNSLKSTNGAAHETKRWLIDQNGVWNAVVGVLRAPEFNMTSRVWDVQVEYQNQPEGSHVTETALQNAISTNGQVYRTAAEVTALRKEVAELKEMLSAVLSPVKSTK